jgi:hypothetical protein
MQNLYRTCQIQNHFVSLWMMPHMDYMHYNELYFVSTFQLFCHKCGVWLKLRTLRMLQCKDVPFMLTLCGTETMCQISFALNKWWKLGAYDLWRKSRMWRWGMQYLIACTYWYSWHQPLGDHWIFQGTWEREVGGMFWYL